MARKSKSAKPDGIRSIKKPMIEQAQARLRKVLDLSSRHSAKQSLDLRGSKATGKIHSVRTFEKYTQAYAKAGSWAHAQFGVTRLNQITPEMAQAYLAHRVTQGLCQKQLDADRMALSFDDRSLERVFSLKMPDRSSRRYTAVQMTAVADAQTPKHALATQIAYWAGLRAHELLTIERAVSQGPSAHRQWKDGRFAGREGIVYLTTGKGGLRREVLIPADLVKQLEAIRHDSPRTVTDRGVIYQQHYDLGGGNAWSKSFTTASQRVLGWSNGAHGLRHSYAQQRLEELQAQRLTYTEARDTVSQELGHFRGDVVETYLR